MATQITAHAVGKSYDDRVVLDAVTCSFPVGQRTGIVGENGSGKTTLLRLLAHREQPDHGYVVITADAGIGYLPQDATLPPHLTVRQVIDDALRELRAIEARMRHLELAMAHGDDSVLEEYGRIQTLFELRGGYDADARVERALHGVGIGWLRHDRVVGTLSGGEQVRLNLAAVLASEPEVLLLDEPTNHLDEKALTWFEDHLRSRRGTTVAVSHDRMFLERVTTTLVEVDGDRHTVTRYGNGYAGYLAEKTAARHRWEQSYQQWEDDIDRLRETVATTARQVAPNRGPTDRNKMAYARHGARVQQSVASRVRNAEERLRRLRADPVPRPPEPLRFRASLHTNDAHGVLLNAVDVSVAGRLTSTSLIVKTGERVLITGANGAGKTTLLRVLVGELNSDTGQVSRRGSLGYLPQEVPLNRPHRTVLAAFCHGRTGSDDEHAQRLLSLGLLGPDHLTTEVGKLSTGQRQRLALARLLADPVDALLLDEPTNHLSPALVEELEAALADFGGALVVVSHDRLLRQRWRGTHRTLSGHDA